MGPYSIQQITDMENTLAPSLDSKTAQTDCHEFVIPRNAAFFILKMDL